MFQNKPCPFEEDIVKATSENNVSEDWSLIMHICDNAVNYSDGAKLCLKTILKRLHHNVPRVVMQALTLLDACVKNCDRNFLLQVASSEFTTEVRKLLAKMHPSASLKLKELLQKWSLEEFKDDPELCIIPALYYKLKSEGVEFPPQEKEKKPTPQICSDPDAVTSQEEENDIIKAIEISLKDTGKYSVPVNQDSPDSFLAAKSTSEPFKVRAIYDFDAAEDNELTIKIGEIVLVSDNSNSSWWKGSNHRGEGLFPANFVTEDLDAELELPKVESSSEIEIVSEVSEEIEIDEKKIDECLNWLSDVDPTEEPCDPEEMLKLEKECYKMGPLIEEHLQTIDNRLAKLSLVNEKIMAAFELFHEFSVQYPTLPANMKFLPSAIQMSFTNPQSTAIQSNTNPLDSVTQESVLSPSDAIHTLSQQEVNKAADTSQTPVNCYVPPNLNSDKPSTNLSSNLPSTVSEPLNNQPTHPAAVINPYAMNMMGSVFIPPGMPIPFPPNTQQVPSPYFPISGNVQNFMPHPAQPLGPYIPYSYYYMNNAPLSVQPQQTVDATSSNNQTQSVTLSTSTSVSNVLSSTPLPSVSSYYSDLQQIETSDSSTASVDNTLKQEPIQGLCVQASGDGQNSTSTSSSENL